MKKAQERVEKEKKKANKARRIRTVTSGIFEDEDLELQLARLERETVRKSENSGRRKLRRVRKGSLVSSSSSQRADSSINGQPSVMGSCNNYSSKKMSKADEDWSKLCKFNEEMELETKEVEESGDF